MPGPLETNHWLNSWVKDNLIDHCSILDVGAGIRPFRLKPYKNRLCIEPHDEYCRVLLRGGYRVLHGTALGLLSRVKGFDLVVLIDVIEHMEKEGGKKVLEAAKEVANHQVFVFTPLGFMPQDYKEGEKDAWGFNGAFWQTHRSGWVEKDFPGWNVKVAKQYHEEPSCGAIAAIYNK